MGGIFINFFDLEEEEKAALAGLDKVFSSSECKLPGRRSGKSKS